MSIHTEERTPRDSGWINLEEPREVRYWTAAFAVSEARLRSAVRAAGDATSAVRQYLGGQQRHTTDAVGDSSLQMPSSMARSSSSGTQQQG